MNEKIEELRKTVEKAQAKFYKAQDRLNKAANRLEKAGKEHELAKAGLANIQSAYTELYYALDDAEREAAPCPRGPDCELCKAKEGA